jgi:(p)ppGpp synthase/HD superfamily hydrolase
MKTQRTKDMQRLMDALDICRKFHINQTDKCGQPYWIHPFTVGMMNFNGYTNEKAISYAIVGLLHDIPEDTGMSVKVLETLIGLTEEEVAALWLLTRTKNMSYDEYIDSIIKSGNEIALNVKCHDLLHNMNLDRFTEAGITITDKDEARHNKYRKALDKLIIKINEG